MILVTGASGTVGSELVRQLTASGRGVRVLTRDPKSHTFPKGVNVAVGDFAHPDTLTEAFQDIQRVFVLTSGEHIADYDAAVVAAARKAGVEHIVKLSVMGIAHGSADPITRWHKAGEEIIKDSGIAWTFLRPSGFMSNALGWASSIKKQGTVYAPFGESKVAAVDPYDIAAMAVCALTQSGHNGKAYEISGPEALTSREQVEKLGTILEKPLTFVDVAPEAARQNIEAMGVPPVLANAIVESMAQAQETFSAAVLDTVAEVTGAQPHSFDQWARAHAAAFRGQRSQDI